MVTIIFLIFAVIWLVICPTFRESRTFLDLLREASPYFLSVLGVSILMISGDFDLSIGSVLAFVNVGIVVAFKYIGNMWLSIIIGLVLGLAVGAFNSLVVNQLKVSSLVATLAMMFALRGAIYIYTNQVAITVGSWPAGLQTLYYGSWAKIPIPFVISIILLIILYLILKKTAFGRNVYAIGGNIDAAMAAGINIKRTKFILFVLSSFLTSIGAVLITAQISSGYFDLGSQGWELTVIAACVLGGLSLSGGKGSLIGAVIGMGVIVLTYKGLRLMGVYTTWMLVTNGLIMIFALYAYSLRKSLINRLK
jgi:ribose transport system permease protein